MPKSNLLNSRLGALHARASDIKRRMATIDESHYEPAILSGLKDLQVALALVQAFTLEAIHIAQLDYDRRDPR